jgi:TetR/AcrR family transcriptional regulator, transcriptional repressor of bet genes
VPKRVDHEQRRQLIVEAVWRITVHGGLAAATFREIAAEAGVSVRLVQYYFGSKADLLHAANQRVGERAGARILKRVRRIGADAPPEKLVRGVIREFLPLDDERREDTILFNAFYTAQLTNPALARSEAVGIPAGLATFFANQIRRAQKAGTAAADIDPDLEGWMLTAVVPNLASGILVNYITARQATRVLDYAIDGIFTSSRSRNGRRT